MASRMARYLMRSSRGIATTAAPPAGEAIAKEKAGPREDYVPVYVALGMIMVSLSLGLYTLKMQLSDNPGVRVSKKRRETLPEVEEPERVAEEGNRYIKNSIFRKVANMQDFDVVRAGISDPTREKNGSHNARMDTLKSVGAESRSDSV